MKKNYIFAFITVFVWSTNATVSKMLLTDIPSLETLAISSGLAFLFLLLMNIKTGIIKTIKDYSKKDIAAMAGLGFLGLFVYSALYYYGLTILTSQEACILNHLWPIMIVVFSAIILKEKLTVIKAAALLFSFFGIVILSSGTESATAENPLPGIISCILAAACYGLFSVLNKKADYDQNIAMMIIWFVTAVCSTATGLFAEKWVPITGAKWLGFLWLGIVINAVAYLLWALALKGTKDTAKIANLAYLIPFLSLVVSAVVLKEQLTARVIIALVFIVGGILFQNLYEFIKNKKTARG